VHSGRQSGCRFCQQSRRGRPTASNHEGGSSDRPQFSMWAESDTEKASGLKDDGPPVERGLLIPSMIWCPSGVWHPNCWAGKGFQKLEITVPIREPSRAENNLQTDRKTRPWPNSRMPRRKRPLPEKKRP